MAAAVLGDETKHEILQGTHEENFENLAQGAIDILSSHTDTSMHYDVYGVRTCVDPIQLWKAVVQKLTY